MYRKDPELRSSIDDIVLTDEQKLELKRCYCDIFHFAKYFKVINSEGFTPIELRDYQKKILQSYVNGTKQHTIVCACRQCGKTTLNAIYALWYAMVTPNALIGIISNRHSQACEIMSIIKQAYHALPLWLQTGLDLERGSGVWSSDSIALANHTRIFVAACSSSAICGRSPDVLIVDEAAHIDDNLLNDFARSVFPTVVGRKNAKVILSSTPKGMNFFYQVWQKAMAGKMSFEPIKVTYEDAHYDLDPNWRKEMELKFGKIFVEQEYMSEFHGDVRKQPKDDSEAYKKYKKKEILAKIDKLLKELAEL